ncbi:Ribonuclease Zc3h12a-like protein [Artemisia annua]|uniref:ribonuclease P n=1 Tax=Artemisia annua TaxID=35608 RepID=A0A2U1L7M1_ARTAN|nr:Ribonuclease Zc3h12a-like protein [Artemisia annua]
MANKKTSKTSKTLTPESKFRTDFSTCSKTKDFQTTISLFQYAITQKIKLNLHQYNTFLYICSNQTDPSTKKEAIQNGYLIFNHIMQNNINPNEGTVTSMCRLAAADNDGDYAFELVKKLESFGDKARLRTYDPALFCFVEKREAEKAYLVEEEILRNGLCLEESEINGESSAEVVERWFKGEVAVKVGCGGLGEGDLGRVKDAVLRNGGRDETEKFAQSVVGLAVEREKRSNFTQFQVSKAFWFITLSLGSACYAYGRLLITEDLSFYIRLMLVDLSIYYNLLVGNHVFFVLSFHYEVAFHILKDWLDQHNDFEAIVDGANIGLYQQNFAEGGFSVSQQLEVVVSELYKRSNKWPLVILHDKRIRGLLANPANRGLLQGWIDNGILYGTPVGSNDDWYWLYASVKLKCMLVTNDQMRDHIFELLGSSFFPMWKERHQVGASFRQSHRMSCSYFTPILEKHHNDTILVSLPCCYLRSKFKFLVMESVRGAWHVPIAGECNDESLRTWLCITRPGRCKASDEVSKSAEPVENGQLANGNTTYESSVSSHSTGITGKRKER